MLYNGSSLAFVGDAVLSLQVRKYLVETGVVHPNRLQQLSTRYVSAHAQAEFMNHVLKLDLLNEDEMGIYRRGVNYKNHSKAKNVDIKTYKIATGLEALWGYWYLNGNEERLLQMWQLFIEFKEKEDE